MTPLRVSHDLYANPKSGFREFYNNECRACRTASRLFGAHPSIEVTLVPSQRKFIVQGLDSLGISQDKFLQVPHSTRTERCLRGSQPG